MVDLIWNFLREIQEDKEYILVATSGLQAPPLNMAMSDEIIELTNQVVGQLRDADGCMGYALHNSFMPYSEWTVSIWESDDAVNQFFRTGTHLAVIKKLGELIQANFKHARWLMDGSELPPAWEQILEELDQKDAY
ncbi:MAG: hypothetical protein DWQ07_23135 [Chloroflexi bacterium]|nr:MAG: hypothetical protein DWQ07_23135 [Chloroflexota bacterium]MBL1194044.1 hypothetical protein [Chloroflexota bacterium]NOH11338.1 hypothetical protein [Chloroflexota bacterium]